MSLLWKDIGEIGPVNDSVSILDQLTVEL